jgi:hypothetical protein
MSVALAVQLTTVPTVAGDGSDGFKSVTMAALDVDSKAIRRKSKVSQQFRAALKDFIDSPLGSEPSTYAKKPGLATLIIKSGLSRRFPEGLKETSLLTDQGHSNFKRISFLLNSDSENSVWTPPKHLGTPRTSIRTSIISALHPSKETHLGKSLFRESLHDK